MQKAIRKYLKKEAEKIDRSMGKDYINQTFDISIQKLIGQKDERSRRPEGRS